MSAGHLFTDTLIYASVTGRTGGGEATYGSQVPLPCRWESKSIKITDPDGVERVGSHVAVTEIEIPTNAQVWGPDDDTADSNAARRVIGRRKARIPSTGYELHETVF